MLKPGDAAPDVMLTMPDGSAKSLSDWRGKSLVLYFYPKDDTTGCTAEAQAFTELIGDFDGAGAAVLGVSRDTPAKHGKFIAKYDLKVALATDADDSVCEAFGTWVEKSMYGRNYMGIERATFLIDKDGRIARIWRKVKVKGHAEEVLAAVKALG
ncbi:peroxiredoxin [Sphingomonas cavernae]|uniref:thioredoxin-dependent peroxiredoxin n=1 Tax=Sphingomonas cavernae TaxID=2320861 RepID=A0A418WKT5_9SPHN|nr:peroxiredoxin [Sphingomonas cavernae]RJF90552.1 peroxiredoxin [Sphingomonas cavernae]